MVRFKHRYLVIRIHYKNEKMMDLKLNQDELKHLLRKYIKLNFGILGLGLVQSSLTIPYFSSITGIGIVRTNRDHYRMVWQTLTLITELNEIPCRILGIHCSGTIKKSIRAAIQYDQAQIKKLQLIAQNENKSLPPHIAKAAIDNQVNLQKLQD